MRKIRGFVLIAAIACLVAACGKSSTNNDAPLAFVPADTAYVYANIEPTPVAVTEQWSKRMQDYMPALLNMYYPLLDKAQAVADPAAQRGLKIARVVLDELKAHSDWDKLRQIGLRPDARIALYGVGLVPVVRMELGDPAAFRAEVARIEEKVGEKLPVAKAGSQEYWQVGGDKLAVVAAIEGTHLVLTIVPLQADETLKLTLLGVNRPAQSIAAAGTLDALAKQRGYSPYGEGFIDIVKLTERLTAAPTGTDAEFAKALDLPYAGTDAACRSEFLDIAHKFPRFVAGMEEMNAQRMRIGAQLDIEPALARDLSAALGAAPGTGAKSDALLDVAMSLPLLKLKDFWIKQADGVAAKPFTCPSLAPMNAAYQGSKQKVDVTIPPPASDITGFRFTLDNINFDAAPGMIPDFAGKILFASTNPTAALAMAQLAVPPLASLKIAPDSKPVAVPAGVIPAPAPPLAVAMSDKAIAISAGAGEDASLGAYLAAPAAAEAVFLRMHFSGKFYALLGQAFEKLKAKAPAEQQAQLEIQTQLFALYEKWLHAIDIEFVATADGVVLRESVEQN